MKNTIKFEKILLQILDIFNLPKQDKEEIVKKFKYLSSINFSTMLFERVKQNSDFKEKLEPMKDNPDTEEGMNKDIFELVEYFDKSIDADEKSDFYLLSQLNVFMDIIQPFINKANEKELVKIGNVLRANEQFYNLYTTLKETVKNTTPDASSV